MQKEKQCRKQAIKIFYIFFKSFLMKLAYFFNRWRFD